jgi:DNA polymerase (family 10)
VLGHPTGRLILKREGHKADMTRVIEAAAAAGVALEINSQVDRLDLDDLHARRARDAGARIVIDSDAHSTTALGQVRWGVTVARRGWLTAADVLNTRSLPELRKLLKGN